MKLNDIKGYRIEKQGSFDITIKLSSVFYAHFDETRFCDSLERFLIDYRESVLKEESIATGRYDVEVLIALITGLRDEKPEIAEKRIKDFYNDLYEERKKSDFLPKRGRRRHG